MMHLLVSLCSSSMIWIQNFIFWFHEEGFKSFSRKGENKTFIRVSSSHTSGLRRSISSKQIKYETQNRNEKCFFQNDQCKICCFFQMVSLHYFKHSIDYDLNILKTKNGAGNRFSPKSSKREYCLSTWEWTYGNPAPLPSREKILYPLLQLTMKLNSCNIFPRYYQIIGGWGAVLFLYQHNKCTIIHKCQFLRQIYIT